jgi:hypothetical protein
MSYKLVAIFLFICIIAFSADVLVEMIRDYLPKGKRRVVDC